eukprot:gnl/Dysnectes_brevis/2861_a3496_1737.p1 GENE.gnl/Dysnectes_brevis/2861_a3496_1737~~gnl/Dysnectes_brevis/2861_a3496_1737.p1  ORF type:complete len:113 (+),score=4.05 gnl/Dysnectes_brevis/2861_a3496_1737:76-414(+)
MAHNCPTSSSLLRDHIIPISVSPPSRLDSPTPVIVKPKAKHTRIKTKIQLITTSEVDNMLLTFSSMHINLSRHPSPNSSESLPTLASPRCDLLLRSIAADIESDTPFGTSLI